MGEVYRARDTRLDRTVAIKVLPTHASTDPELRERFEREARAASNLNHPHICVVYDVGHQDGIDFLVMEHLEGETVASRLERGPLPLDQVVRVALDVAAALDLAHRRGIVHRDIKPSNVMLTRTGAKLMDFGLAKLREMAPGRVVNVSGQVTAATLTARGTILGTLQYMAPEQLEGRDTDARTDIFAFGALVHEMATGRRAFDGASQATLIGAILRDQPPPISSVQPLASPALDRLVQDCLAKDPDDRWQTMRDVMRQLARIGESAPAAVVPPAARARPWREMLAWGLAGGAVLATLAILFWPRPKPPVSLVTRFSVPAPENTTFPFGSALALSPDGRRLAFVASDLEGRRQLWIRPLDSLGMQPLAGTNGADIPFWSPDGRFLAFFADSRLKKIDTASGTIETLCEAGIGEAGTWNRDDVILFVPRIESGIFRVSALGGVPAAVTKLDPTRGDSNHLGPRFLPDGRHFIYQVFAKQDFLCVASLDEPDRCTQKLESLGLGLDVSPSGHLIYVRGRTLMAHPFDAVHGTFTGEPVRLAEGIDLDPPGPGAFSVSNTGVLAYRDVTSQTITQLAWLNRQGQVLGTIGEPGSYASFSSNNGTAPGGVSIAPDGRSVAVERWEDGEPSIWLMDVKRGTSVRLTRDWSALPMWSPDGARVVFADASDGPPNLSVKAPGPDGPGERLTTAPVQHYPSDWSRDGNWIVYQATDDKTGHDIWLLPVSGDQRPKPFLRTSASEGHARVAPDGRWMAYVSDESGRKEVYVTSFPAPGVPTPISAGGGVAPHWRADGRELFYLAPGGRMMAVAVGSGRTFEAGAAATLFQTEILGSAYDVSPDGRFLVARIVRAPVSPPITVVLNWTASIAR